MLYYRLNKNIDGNKLLQDIQKLLSKHPQDTIDSKILVIKLENVNECSEHNHIPRIEYKPTSPT